MHKETKPTKPLFGIIAHVMLYTKAFMCEATRPVGWNAVIIC